MASLILSTTGSALFGPVGGFLGALAGSQLDAFAQSSLVGPRVEPSRLSSLRVQASAEGAGLPVVWGRMRVAGQVVWASRFKETSQSRRVGGKAGPRVVSHSYAISFAVALSEGPIAGIGKVWANGELLDMSTVAHRVHLGGADQMPDPLIEAIEGIANAPAHRGIALVVFEDLPLDLFGDRIPQVSFEVFAPARPAPGAPEPLESLARAVCLIPGSGEFAYATTPVSRVEGPGRETPENRHAEAGRSDFTVALAQLRRDLPNVESVSLVVAWFGDDLRAGQCTIRPKVETAAKTTRPRAWSAGGLSRAQAQLVSTHSGAPAYGGAPDDASVIEAIKALKAEGLAVTVNPFVMMDVASGNALPDPWGGPAQAPYPWRGRVTCHPAPGRTGSPDGTATATAQVSAFFGAASASDFTVTGGVVSYAGSADWGLRRFVLHLAALAKAAGGVEAFLIGSELVGLTRVRGAGGSWPGVAGLVALAGEVRALLGPGVKIGYGADWTEYGGHVPPGAPGDLRFPLDALWASTNVDFIGLDWYAPLTDRRPGDTRADRATLQAGMAGGEGFDWYYAGEADRLAGNRTAITDAAHGEPWVFRQKDLRSWWSLPHHERAGGVRASAPTAFVPQSKPVWLMELGFPAVDRGANRPSVFPDPKSSETGLPPFSTGARDDLEQRLALETALAWWLDPANNPVSTLTGQPMVQTNRTHLWAWDARPWPAFPGRADVWADGPNAATGHWLPGRLGAGNLGGIVADLCARAGVGPVDTSGVHGLIGGCLLDSPRSARAMLEALRALFGLQFVNTGAGLAVRSPAGPAPGLPLDATMLAQQPDTAAIGFRDSNARPPGQVRLQVFAAERDHEVALASVHGPGDPADILDFAAPVALSPEARAAAARRLLAAPGSSEASVRLSPQASITLEPGDAVDLAGAGHWQVARLEGGFSAEAVLVRADDAAVEASAALSDNLSPVAPAVTGPVWLEVLDLPAPWTDPERPQPLAAAAVAPWPRSVNVAAATGGLVRLDRRARMGTLAEALPEAAPGRLARGPAITLTLSFGELDGGPGHGALLEANGVADVIAWRAASLTGPAAWRLEQVTRGLTGADMAPALPAGTVVVVIDGALAPLALEAGLEGGMVEWRAVAEGLALDGPTASRISRRFDARARLPWPPCHVRARRTAGGVALSWIRRARGDGDSWGPGNAPPAARTERYRLSVLDTSGASVREIETAAPAALYTSAQETGDFGAPQPQLRIAVAQVSDGGISGHVARRTVTIAPL